MQGIYRPHGASAAAGDAWNWYWLEVIDYAKSQSASRILVTTKLYPELASIKFDPYVRGGPVYAERDEIVFSHKFYALKRTAQYNGRYTMQHTVEFLHEADYR